MKGCSKFEELGPRKCVVRPEYALLSGEFAYEEIHCHVARIL